MRQERCANRRKSGNGGGGPDIAEIGEGHGGALAERCNSGVFE
jgi:hypothetical protein